MIVLFVSLMIAAFTVACGGRSSTLVSLQDGTVNQPQPWTGLSLPSPQELAQRAASFTEQDLTRMGREFDAGLVNKSVAASGMAADFLPGAGMSRADLAFAIYGFGLDGYDRDANLRLSWSIAPQAGSCYLILANFSTGRWDWFQLPATHVLDLTSLAPYTSPALGSPLYCAVLVSSADARLERIRVGTQPAVGDPVATLDADVLTGFAPLSVNFDASGSAADPPAVIVNYEFSYGDAPGFIDLADNPFADHTYNTPGQYTAQVRVTDLFGGQDTASVLIEVLSVSDYDEVEDNDSAAEANLLSLPTNGFRASLGSGVGYPGYDGDEQDWFVIDGTLNAGDELGITLRLDATMSDIDVELYDNNMNWLGGSYDTDSVENILYTVTPGDALPLLLYCNNLGGLVGGSDYSLYVAVGQPTAVLQATPRIGSLPLNVDFDASGSSDVPPGSIVSYEFDFEGDGVYDLTQATPLASHVYATQGVFNATLRVTDDEGNQSVDSVRVAPGYEYDEIEDNDNELEGTQLPAFPFSGFRGNLGVGGVYDGDEVDFFYLPVASPGDLVGLTLTYPASANHDCELYDSSWNYLGGSYSVGTTDYIAYNIVGTENLPLLLVVYTMFGASDYELAGGINPPTAVLTATPPGGPSPLNVSLDASASSDIPPGSIVKFEFDPLGSGVFVDNGMGDSFAHLYPTDGVYLAAVRVTDDEGNTALATAAVLVGVTFDEVEDNDNMATANPLPAFPFAAWTGSHGNGPSYAAYDGDMNDYVSFNGNPGELLTFTLSYDNANGEMSIDLYDVDGSNLAWDDGSGGLAEIFEYELGSSAFDDGGPYTLRIWDLYGAHYGDYSLAGILN